MCDEVTLTFSTGLPMDVVVPYIKREAFSGIERERELHKEGREVPSRVRLREGPIVVRITLGQPTIG